MIIYLIIILLLYIIIKKNNLIENISFINIDDKKECCLIKKEYVLDENNLDGGDFKYIIKTMKDDNCNHNKYISNNNQQLYINDNNKCNIDNIGSCRNYNKECIDFVDKNFCDKYDMIWSNKTCHNSLDFEWKDPIKIKIN